MYIERIINTIERKCFFVEYIKVSIQCIKGGCENARTN